VDVSQFLIMTTLETGNVIAAGDKSRGWFVGDLAKWAGDRGEVLDPASTLRQNLDVQVKWYEHPPGDRRSAWAPPDQFYTLTIIVTGVLRLEMRATDGTEQRVTLQHAGDYIIWHGPDYAHSWHTEEGCTLITVRWPVRHA
jgi:hypothetical protein